jgi:hypothetical protein
MKTRKLRCLICNGKVQMAEGGRSVECVRCAARRDWNPAEGGPQYADPVRNAITKEQEQEEAALRETRVRRMR